MFKFIAFYLLVAGLCGCELERAAAPLPMVTDIVMPSVTTANPGDEVPIAAKGFEADDDIFISVAESTVRAEVLVAEYSSIRFIVPGGLPDGEAEVLLIRGGNAMVIGSMTLSSGLPPTQYSLYGIGRNGECISLIDPVTGVVTPVVTFGDGERLSGVVNASGTNRIYGINDASGKRCPALYDLTTKRFVNSGREGAIAMGVVGATGPAYLYLLSAGRVMLTNGGITRSTGGDFPAPPAWELPASVDVGMLEASPFVSVRSAVLFSAQLAARRFMPVVMELADARRMFSGEAFDADSVLPFRISTPSEHGSYPVGGYAIVNGRETVFKLYNHNTKSFVEELLRTPAAVVSCTNTSDANTTELIYMLCQTDDGLRVGRYDLTSPSPQAAFSFLTGPVDLSEIVLAR